MWLNWDGMYQNVVLFNREGDGLMPASPPQPMPQEKPGRLVGSPYAGNEVENTIAHQKPWQMCHYRTLPNKTAKTLSLLGLQYC